MQDINELKSAVEKAKNDTVSDWCSHGALVCVPSQFRTVAEEPCMTDLSCTCVCVCLCSQIKSVITILGTFSAIAFTISRFVQMAG